MRVCPRRPDASDADRQQFYTAIYHSMLMPTDRTGENPLFQSSEPMYDDFYAIWDTFRTSSPLLTLVAQDRESGIVRGLVDLYRHEGWLPDARSGNFNGRVQGGSDADMTSARPGNTETAVIAKPATTTYYIRIVGVAAYGGLNLLASYSM